MNLKSVILGIAATAALLSVLVATRLLVNQQVSPEYEIREIETVTLPEPPPPPPEQAVDEDVPPPPPPALADPDFSMDLSLPALPVSEQRIDPRLAVDTFYSDQPPSPLPVIAKPSPRPQPKPQVKASPRPVVKSSAPKPKSEYSLGELDQQPRLLRNPSVVFPRSIKDASSGKVVVRVAIQPSGSSEFVAVISSTHPELIPLARRIADGSRFTPPTRQGKAVKAVMTWPIIIKR